MDTRNEGFAQPHNPRARANAAERRFCRALVWMRTIMGTLCRSGLLKSTNPHLQFLTPSAYISRVIRVRPGDYGDKRLCNKQPGPGGGTRRLHHKLICGWVFVGAKQDRRTCKGTSFARCCSAVIGLLVQVPTIMKWPSLPNLG